ncbi:MULTISPECIES: KpsF/GutQ family sugar-phosphate isomerase [Rhizobium]|uniref:KpsF/GutQ family protein n=1 Tax=Rhizobium favelukesii TaxID=348824 RepID=W6RFT4_9HYPH|nr:MULTISPECIES: KpsF/GutQ family sugar-phosphate isomerase [Rhizobium]MCS0462834.1 KpsF/GutQ family sugar-phosphate isomerase [Rhizobium favelukesii]UFS83238.1 KpsF/GutQ family sugar-phosphate isomerase [Rhizobium sp. T136]CDM59195.1 KpsF/GutQ family protein [Rhizobium favelukesii]
MIKRAVNVIENGVLESAKRTIGTERRALEALERAFDDGLTESFMRAVETITGITGRVIVTGVGKSGHIGVKIAATLASTGTPAFFVHAAEANHGDLGMIGTTDVVLALSKGGESAELRSIVAYTRRFLIPLIAVTCSEKSSLATAADIILLMPNEEEACPHGLAPTTSTLMQLAMGDALAIALLDARGFSARDFHVFHPGGKLGASLSHVADIMHTGDRVPLVAKGTSVPEAISTLSRKHFGCVGIVEGDGRLCGIVTEGDVARNLTRNLSELLVDDIMTRTPKTVKPTVLATAALAMLNQHSIGALIVVDDENRPIGLVHFHDLLRIGVA